MRRHFHTRRIVLLSTLSAKQHQHNPSRTLLYVRLLYHYKILLKIDLRTQHSISTTPIRHGSEKGVSIAVKTVNSIFTLF